MIGQDLSPPLQFTPSGPRLLKLVDSLIYGVDRVFGRVMTLDEEKLTWEARARTGLDDFGDESFREPLRILCGISRKDPCMTAYGRYITRVDLLRRLINKLKIQADFTNHPEILDEDIREPIFIIGLPRTGTTLLHRLLSQDPAHRALRPWEMNQPSPSPAYPSSNSDPRIKRMEKAYAWMYYAMPALRSIHEINARAPEECILLMANCLISEYFVLGIGGHDDYREWLYAQDLSSTYRFHREQLQLLQWKWPARRWVLKAPFHLHGLRWLLKVYPDARILHVHRNPLEVLPSAASMVATTMSCFFSTVDPFAIGQKVASGLAGLLWNGLKARAIAQKDGHCRAIFHDVYYRDLITNPIEAIDSVYHEFGLDLSNKARESMMMFLQPTLLARQRKHHYAFEMFGLSEDSERRRFRHYIDHFGLND